MKLFFVLTFWRAAFLDSLLILGGVLHTSQNYQDRCWFIRGGILFGKGKIRLPAWVGYVSITSICVALLISPTLVLLLAKRVFRGVIVSRS
ncbi:MAG: hypothetical protein DRZ90_10610 [Spirochaetes bacterium]|nr:MAG: hypothetical protein DRZ90_10610 [Spirochaetota bacterium]